ncbi:MAG: hypothetical protein AB7N76_18570 [Planctomycetota bacterium]
MKRAALILAALLLASCAEHHYLVLRDQLPLYADAGGEQVLERLPRYHHEPLAGDPEFAGDRVRVSYRGLEGYVPRAGVDLFSYLAPGLDGGEARDEAVFAHLREARLAQVGKDWSPWAVEAVRRGEVLAGMSREQVEVCWGWPTRLEREDGGERWVWEAEDVDVIHRYEPSVAYYGYGAWRPGGPPCLPYGGFRGDMVWATYRIPVLDRRVVRFDEKGLVRSVDHQRLRR